MQYQTITRRASTATFPAPAVVIASYAAINFGYHLMHSSSAVDSKSLLAQLSKFLRSNNALTWIERLAESGDLSILQQTAHRLEGYLAQRAKDQQLESEEVQTVTAWVTDIRRLVATFHTQLLASPSSIYFLVPHFCPSGSILCQLSAQPAGRFSGVTGPLHDDGDDKLTCDVFGSEATCVAWCEGLLAAGARNGNIWIYDAADLGTFQPVGTVFHGENIRHLAFNSSSSLLASCSTWKLALWNVCMSKGPPFRCLWTQELDFTPSRVLFSELGDFIMLSDPRRSVIVTVRAVDGVKDGPVPLPYASPESDSGPDSDQQQAGAWTVAEQVRIEPHLKLAAMTYCNSLVSIRDVEPEEKDRAFREGRP